MKRLFSFLPSESVLCLQRAFAYTPKVFSLDITYRPYSGLLYVRKGSYVYTYARGHFRAEEGSVIYLPPLSQPYSYCVYPAEDGSAAQTVQVEFELKNLKSGNVLTYASHPILILTQRADLCNDFLRVVEAAEKKDSASVLLLQAELYRLLAKCAVQTESAQVRIQDKIAPAVLYLRENYKKKIQIDVLAKLCHISQSQLRRLFRKEMGMSPLAYKKELLVADAKSMIDSGLFSVGEISELLGFYDIYAFSHFFAEETGMSPSAYKNRRRTL